MLTRRGFLGALAALPFLGFLKPEPVPQQWGTVTLPYYEPPVPAVVAATTNTRRAAFIGARAAELKWSEPQSLDMTIELR